MGSDREYKGWRGFQPRFAKISVQFIDFLRKRHTSFPLLTLPTSSSRSFYPERIFFNCEKLCQIDSDQNYNLGGGDADSSSIFRKIQQNLIFEKSLHLLPLPRSVPTSSTLTSHAEKNFLNDEKDRSRFQQYFSKTSTAFIDFWKNTAPSTLTSSRSAPKRFF